MKLFIILATIAACSAGALNRQYLPAQSSFGAGQSSFGTSQSSFGSSQSSFANSQSSFAGSSQSGFTGSNQSNRPQQAAEKNAAILKLDSEVTAEGFQYSYETENGIRAEESGNAGGSRGGFSYKGDDGQTYTVTFTAGDAGFIAQGAHLPVAPPTPDAILKALDQNAKDEASGIFDDGKYRAVHQSGGQYQHQVGSSQGSKGTFQTSFASGNHQQSFNAQTGYKY